MIDNSSIATLSEDDFNSLFEEVPANSVNANTIVGGKEKKEEDPIKKVGEDEVVVIAHDGNDIETIENIDSLFEDGTEDNTDAKKEEGDDKTKSPDDSKASKAKKPEEKVEQSDDEKANVNGVLKSTVDYLISKGHWLDFEGREELEVNDEVYAELAAKQDEARLTSMFNELIDSTGPYGKAIINFAKEGGNPEEIIDIFKEQKQIENFDTSSEDGQKALIDKYYSEVLNWKSEKIKRHITTLISGNELDTEVSDIKALYEDHSMKELQRVNKEQEEFRQKQKNIEDNFKKNITSVISSNKDLTDRERRELQSSILDYKHKLPTGQVVNDFYLKFAEIQANPESYIDLVSFVMDKESYFKKRDTKIKNKEVDSAFNFVKGNIALGKNKGSSHEDVKKQDNKIAEFSFGIPRK